MSNDELVAKYQAGDKNILNELIEQNLGIVKWVANSYNLSNISGIGFEDLVQEGSIGIVKAARSYDLNIENKASFITYAIYQIKSRISTYVYKNNNYDKCELNELAYDKGNKTEKIDLINDNKDPYSDTESQIDNEILRKDLEKLMRENLSLKELEMIKFLYGWDGNCMAYKEIGELFGVSDNTIYNWSQIALSKLRDTAWVHNDGAVIYFGDKLHRFKNSKRNTDTIFMENDVVNNFNKWINNYAWGDVVG